MLRSLMHLILLSFDKIVPIYNNTPSGTFPQIQDINILFLSFDIGKQISFLYIFFTLLSLLMFTRLCFSSFMNLLGTSLTNFQIVNLSFISHIRM